MINFSENRWDNIKKNYSLWWENKLKRPLIPVILEGVNPARSKPSAPLLTQATCHDLTISAKDIVDRIDYELSQKKYMGDAFPYFNMDCFGPGVVAAFLGARLDNSTGNVWFHPEEIKPISELYFEYDSNNVWLNRIKEICFESMRFWQGQVLVGMPDLGGILDILSVFRSADNLLLDLYDEPDEVKRLIFEIQKLWFRYYNEINAILQPINPGYSDWSQLYSSTPSYVVQSDFSYMISPAMFDEFVKPELQDTCKKLSYSVYHLDGVGELAHLESLLTIDEIDVIQWVPGDGKPLQSEWAEVYQKINNAGKKIQLFDGFGVLDEVSRQIGTYKGIHQFAMKKPIEQEKEIQKQLDKYLQLG